MRQVLIAVAGIAALSVAAACDKTNVSPDEFPSPDAGALGAADAGPSWTAVALPTPGVTLRAVTGAGPSVVAVGSSGTVLDWNGTTWTPIAAAPAADFTGVAFAGASEWWTVSADGRAWLWLAGAPTESSAGLPASRRLNAVWAPAGGAVWAAGDGGTLVYFDRGAKTWKPFGGFVPLNDLYGLWGTPGSDDGWVVGQSGVVARLNPALATPEAQPSISGTTQNLRAVWGSGPGDVWAGGDNGTLAHWNGSVWSLVPLPAEALIANIHAIWGSGPSDVWFAATTESLIHWNGTTLEVVNPATAAPSADLLGLWGDATGLWAVGDGVILRRSPP